MEPIEVGDDFKNNGNRRDINLGNNVDWGGGMK